MFNSNEFFGAFKQHNLLAEALYTPEIGAPVSFMVGFVSPTEISMADAVQTDEYAIEYERATAPALVEGSQISIDSETYRLRTNPRRRGDGTFLQVLLTKESE